MTVTHRRFRVRVADHEAGDPDRTTWRVEHAAETISLVLAYFTRDAGGRPVQAADGTFEVHATSRTTLGTLRSMLTDHEALTIVAEDDAPGTGIIATVNGQEADYAFAVLDILASEFPNLPTGATIVDAINRHATTPDRFELIVDHPTLANWRLCEDPDNPGRVRLACCKPPNQTSAADMQRERRINNRLSSAG